jgi:hypothetical protein
MDSSFTIKSPLPGVQKSHTPRDPVAVRAAVETDLDLSKTVAATADGGSKSDQRPGDQHGEHPPHDHHAPASLEVDPESRDLIYRERDVRAAEREHPDQALLRQRAYRQAPHHDGEMPSAGDPHADIKA